MSILRIGRGRGAKRTAVDKYCFGERVIVTGDVRHCMVEQRIPTLANPRGRMFFLCDGNAFDADSLGDAIEVVRTAFSETYISLHPAVIGKDLRATGEAVKLPMPSIVGSVAVEIEYDAKAKELQSQLYPLRPKTPSDSAILILRYVMGDFDLFPAVLALEAFGYKVAY